MEKMDKGSEQIFLYRRYLNDQEAVKCSVTGHKENGN